MVVVTHGPELHAFAKENYNKYQGIMDRMKELADDGVEFRMCHNALRAAGFEADDFHGFITVVPAGFPEIVYLQSQGPAIRCRTASRACANWISPGTDTAFPA